MLTFIYKVSLTTTMSSPYYNKIKEHKLLTTRVLTNNVKMLTYTRYKHKNTKCIMFNNS